MQKGRKQEGKRQKKKVKKNREKRKVTKAFLEETSIFHSICKFHLIKLQRVLPVDWHIVPNTLPMTLGLSQFDL